MGPALLGGLVTITEKYLKLIDILFKTGFRSQEEPNDNKCGPPAFPNVAVGFWERFLGKLANKGKTKRIWTKAGLVLAFHHVACP
jgi:hypothetical protein